jgi:hypothetical protein
LKEDWQREYRVALVILAAGFAAIRFACLFNDLWLDEIWSLWAVGQVHAPLEILTRIRQDNNHPLNSLFLYMLMPAKAEWTYRLLSWSTGSATVVLAAFIGRLQYRRLQPGKSGGRAEGAGLIAATLFGGSYFFILYSSEARGYAPAVFFGFLAFYSLLRAPHQGWCRWTAVYWAACALGMLSQPVAFQVIFAGAAYSAVIALRSTESWRARTVRFAIWQFPAGVFFGLYYILVLRPMAPGGSTFLGAVHTPFRNLWGDLAAYSLGFPASVGALLALPVLLVIGLASIVLIWRRDRSLAVFYALAVFVTPLIGLLSGTETVLFPRYFIMSVAFILLLAGYLLVMTGRLHRFAQAGCLVALALFLVGNGVHVGRLLEYGRGQYKAALTYVVQQTPTAVVTVSTDFSEFRNLMVIDHFAKAATGPGRSIQYLPSRRWRAPGPQWLFVERLDNEPAAPDHMVDSFGTYYRLERIFPHAALSGWNWFVYRNTLLLGFPSAQPAAP